MWNKIGVAVFFFTALCNTYNVKVNAAFTSLSRSSSTTFSSRSTSSPIQQSNSKFMGRGMRLQHNNVIVQKSNRKGSMSMFLGSDGILGVGAPEIAVTLLVGYFILGPSDLYKLTKEIGKFIQSFRTLSSEASKSFESSMESQLELQELRKAQTELNNAFSFRRSINVDENGEAFSEKPPMVDDTAVATTATAAATATAASSGDGAEKKKKKRRRVKKVKKQPVVEEEILPYSGDIPDLDMSEEFKKEMKEQLWSKPEYAPEDIPPSPTSTTPSLETEEETAARIRSERIERLQNGQPSTPPDWYSASESDIASEVLSQQTNGETIQSLSPAESAAEKSRFASQLSSDWNQQILANEDKLSPLGKIMERLAILEEEKNAADARLEEEFKLRTENEEKFYREKRKVLEEASLEISSAAYNLDTEETEEVATFENSSNSTSISNEPNVTSSKNTTSVSSSASVAKEENTTKI